MNLTARSKHRSSLSPDTPDLAQLKNENPETATDDITAANDDFLVTAFGQLNQQLELMKI